MSKLCYFKTVLGWMPICPDKECKDCEWYMEDIQKKNISHKGGDVMHEGYYNVNDPFQQQRPKDGAKIKVNLLITKIEKHIPTFDFED